MSRKTAFPHLHVIALCEDYGTKLWPIAREERPVCATPVEPGSKQTLLSAAVQRLSPYTSEKFHVVTTLRMAHIIDGMLANDCKLKMEQYELLVQPTQRGSAFAIALACARIRRIDPQAVVLVVRCDQRVEYDERWERLLFTAYQAAMVDRIAVVGCDQDSKCADWNIMRRGKVFSDVADTYCVKIFSADQSPATAKRLHDRGAYWYSGMLMTRAAVLLGELNRAGDMAATRESEGSHRIAETANFLAQLEPADWLNVAAQEVIETLPIASLDKAMLEVSSRLVLVPTNIKFSAVSSLDDLDMMSGAGRDGNTVVGCGAALSSRNTTIYSQTPDHPVVTLGLRDAMVVELEDMTLVVAKDQLDKIDDARFELERLKNREK